MNHFLNSAQLFIQQRAGRLLVVGTLSIFSAALQAQSVPSGASVVGDNVLNPTTGATVKVVKVLADGDGNAIYVFTDAQRKAAEISRGFFQQELAKNGFAAITTEILDAPTFYYAEDYHQQYLAKNPNGYCGLGGTGVCFP